MLLNINELVPILKCPISGKSIKESDNNLTFETLDGIKYKVIDSIPVFVNFEKSIIEEKSIFATSGASTIKRPLFNGLFQLLKSIVAPTNPKTRKNINIFTNELKKLQISNPNPKILIVGGGRIGNGLEELYQNNFGIISFDVYKTENIQFIADAHDIPLADGSVDGVIIQFVLEHVLNPQRVVDEIFRVLKIDGLVYAETPFLEGVHEGAYDFTRFTELGHRFLFRKFDKINSGYLKGAGSYFLWAIEYLFRGIFRSKIIGKIFKLTFFWVQYLDYLIPDSYNSDAADSTFFLGRKEVDATLNEKNVVKYYNGADAS
jgi:SAM-dependent methyltransferase